MLRSHRLPTDSKTIQVLLYFVWHGLESGTSPQEKQVWPWMEQFQQAERFGRYLSQAPWLPQQHPPSVQQCSAGKEHRVHYKAVLIVLIDESDIFWCYKGPPLKPVVSHVFRLRLVVKAFWYLGEQPFSGTGPLRNVTEAPD
mmetsp:Transcript_4436/g.9680  ORF Transcript_4436/g.9680 Transcript_4436/m.9680 type:complete len:142 (-) Transcript_4436:22-447(-)